MSKGFAQHRFDHGRISLVDLTSRCGRYDDDTFRIWSFAGEVIPDLIPTQFGQHEIEHDRTIVVSLDLCQSVLTVASFVDGIALALENCLHNIANGYIVIDEQNHRPTAGDVRFNRCQENFKRYTQTKISKETEEGRGMPKRATVPPLTSWQTRYVLEKLIDEGKVSAADVRRHVAGMWSEMTKLEKQLAELRAMLGPVSHPMRAIKGVAKKLTRAKRKISAKGRASYRLQGQYVAHIRQIPERERARFKRLAKQEGREKAVAEMKKRLAK